MQTATPKRKEESKALRKPEKKLPEQNAPVSNRDKFSEKLTEVPVDSVEGSQTESPTPSSRPVRKPTAVI